MPKSLMQISKQSHAKPGIKLTDINPNLTGRLGKLGFFNTDWSKLRNNQFYTKIYHKNYYKDIETPLIENNGSGMPLINVQKAEKANMAYKHDRYYMWPYINRITEISYRNSSSNHKKNDFKFEGRLNFYEIDQYNNTIDYESYELSGDFPTNEIQNSAYKKFKSEFDSLSIYTMLYKQLDYMCKHSYDIFNDALEDVYNGVGDRYEKQDIASTILTGLERYSQADKIAQYEALIENGKKNHPEQESFLNELLINNMHLMLMDSVNHLKPNDQSKLTTPIPKSQYIAQIQKAHTYTSEQLDYITSTKRNIVAEAGAGTGKSTALGGRISYLKASGVDPSHILVLSFTNAAADNITNRFPGVKSYTIASVVNGIYRNYYTHHLSDVDTLRNSLKLLRNNPKSDSSTREALIEVLYNISAKRGFRKPDFDQYHHDILKLLYKDPAKVTHELSLVNQTTLELQQSIMYFVLNYQNVLPQSLKDIDFILIDEAQDTSLFELIFLTRLATNIDADINFIGDANQTLYEFRNAYARSLNIISNHKNVSHYVFDINHRSNDYILTMANQVLKVLTTNEKTQMQLVSSHNQKLTTDGYNKTIHFVNNPETISSLGTSSRTKASSIALKNFLRTSHELKQYIDNALKNGEQVAFLALSRNEVTEYYKYLSQAYNPQTIQTLAPLHGRWSSLLSDSLISFEDKGYWKNVNKYTNGAQAGIYIANALTSIMQVTMSKWKYIIPKWATDLVNALPLLLQREKKSNWHNATIHYLESGEIKHNAVANSLRSQEKINLSAPIIISTIHSAKGLEFPHVVMHYMEPSNASDQSTLRALGVGLTRAKNDEFIINSYRTGKYNTRSIDTSASGLFETPLASANQLAINEISKSMQNTSSSANTVNP